MPANYVFLGLFFFFFFNFNLPTASLKIGKLKLYMTGLTRELARCNTVEA